MIHSRRNFALCLWVAVTLQAELATFRGKVTDADGNPIEGAVVTLRDVTRGGTVETKTDRKGSFYRRGLRPSEYELRIAKEGLGEHEERLQFRAGEEKRLDFRLVGAATPTEAHFQRGVEAFNDGDFEGAARAFEEVTRLSPETPEGHTNLALAYIQLRRMPEAVQELEKAAELDPDSFQTAAQLAMAYVQVDRLQAAVRGFESALAKAHDPSDPMAFESWMALGSLYFAESQVAEAVSAYRKALDSSPDAPAALVALGKCHFNQGNTEKALERFRRVVAVAPDSKEAEEARAFLREIEPKDG